MKKNIKTWVIGLLLLTQMQLVGQPEKEIKNSEVEGIYLTIANFKNGKLTIPTDNQHEGDKIKLKQFFISPDIISIEQDTETIFYKDSIFALRLSNGLNYRFINRTPYLIADTLSLYIYSFKTTITENNMVGPSRRSREIPITYFYFSLDNHNAIFKLTLDNLRKYALTDAIVHSAVCNKFTTDEMLSKVNPKTGRFELNETILSSVKK